MASIDADLVVLAVAVSVTKKSDLCCIRSDLLHINAKIVLSSSLFLPGDGVLYLLVVEGVTLSCTRRTKSTHD